MTVIIKIADQQKLKITKASQWSNLPPLKVKDSAGRECTKPRETTRMINKNILISSTLKDT